MFKRRQQATMASVGISFVMVITIPPDISDQLQPGLRATSSQDMHFYHCEVVQVHTLENNNWYVRPMIDAGCNLQPSLTPFKERDAGGANFNR